MMLVFSFSRGSEKRAPGTLHPLSRFLAGSSPFFPQLLFSTLLPLVPVHSSLFFWAPLPFCGVPPVRTKPIFFFGVVPFSQCVLVPSFVCFFHFLSGVGGPALGSRFVKRPPSTPFDFLQMVFFVTLLPARLSVPPPFRFLGPFQLSSGFDIA